MRSRPRSRLAPLALVALLVLAGCFGGGTGSDGADVTLVEEWTAGTSEIEGNHHAVAAANLSNTTDETDATVVAVPIGGHHGEAGCKLLVVDGSGEERWHADIAPEACTIHAVADAAITDFVGDETPEVLAATTEEQVVGYDPLTGEAVFRQNLSDYGYTRPVVADVTGDGADELVVSDVRGTVYVVRPDGAVVWTRSLDAFSWSAPAINDFDTDGTRELALGLGNGTALAFTHEGDIAWRQSVEGKITWTTSGDLDGDDAREFVVATTAGTVAALDGRDGSVEWTREFESHAAVEAVGDLDGVERSSTGSAAQPPTDDGTVEVYATARDGDLRALDGATGETAWTVTLTEGDVQMTPPPVAGDVTGDGRPELVAVTNDGRTNVVSPAGEILASHERDASVYTHATVADTDGHGAGDVYVIYGDGTVAALSVQNSTSSTSS
jgi:hypothetical protein